MKQDVRRYAERLSELSEHEHSGVPRASFDPADIGAMKPGLEGELLLRPSPFAPDPPHVETELLPDVHTWKQARL